MSDFTTNTKDIEMHQVSKDQFFKVVNPLDVHPRITTATYPYTSVWELQRNYNRLVIGKTVGRMEGGKAVTDYYLTDNRT